MPEHSEEEREYLRRLEEQQPLPETEFEHKAWLVAPDKTSINNFYDLLNKAVSMANIQSDRVMYFVEQEARILVHFFDMSKRNEALKPVFNQLFYSFLMSLNLTRSFKGLERQLQATHSQPQYVQGFGSGLEKQYEQQERAQGRKGLELYG